MSDMARVLELVAEAESLLSDATELTPEKNVVFNRVNKADLEFNDGPLWDAINILRTILTYWPNEEDDE